MSHKPGNRNKGAKSSHKDQKASHEVQVGPLGPLHINATEYKEKPHISVEVGKHECLAHSLHKGQSVSQLFISLDTFTTLKDLGSRTDQTVRYDFPNGDKFFITIWADHSAAGRVRLSIHKKEGFAPKHQAVVDPRDHKIHNFGKMSAEEIMSLVAWNDYVLSNPDHVREEKDSHKSKKEIDLEAAKKAWIAKFMKHGSSQEVAETEFSVIRERQERYKELKEEYKNALRAQFDHLVTLSNQGDANPADMEGAFIAYEKSFKKLEEVKHNIKPDRVERVFDKHHLERNITKKVKRLQQEEKKKARDQYEKADFVSYVQGGKAPTQKPSMPPGNKPVLPNRL